MKAVKSTKAGFTLVEAMLGMFLLALVISGSLVALGQGMTLSEKSRRQTEADFYLRAETENLRSMTWAEVETLKTSIDSANGQTVAMQALPIDSPLTGTIEATLRQNGTIADQMMFRLRVVWTDRNGKGHEESRLIMITEGGLSAET